MDEFQKGMAAGKVQAAESDYQQQAQERNEERAKKKIVEIDSYVRKRMGDGFYTYHAYSSSVVEIKFAGVVCCELMVLGDRTLLYLSEGTSYPEWREYEGKNLDVGTPELDRLLGLLFGRYGEKARQHFAESRKNEVQTFDVSQQTYILKWIAGALLVILALVWMLS